jgi:hypothetical protein
LFSQSEVDVEASILRINWIFSSDIINPDLNFVWSDLDWTNAPGEIVGVTIDPTSTWAPSATIGFTADSVTLTNNDDTSVAVGDLWLANLEVEHIPEPNSLAILLFGFMGLMIRQR